MCIRDRLRERIADKDRALKGIGKSLRALGRLSLLTQSAALSLIHISEPTKP